MFGTNRERERDRRGDRNRDAENVATDLHNLCSSTDIFMVVT